MYLGTLCLKEGLTEQNFFIPDTPFLRDHIWSHVELFNETLMYNDAHSLQSFPRERLPEKLVMFYFRHIVFSENAVPADKGVHLPVSHLLSAGARLPVGVLRRAGALRRPQRRSTQSRPSRTFQTYT